MATSSRQDKIKLGVFVALVLAAGVGILIFFVGVTLGEETKSYTVYFEQSITGLTPGSQVTLNGVRVGEVYTIGVDPENVERVIVTLSVKEETPVKVDTKAFLSSQGITGLKYVDLQESTHKAAGLPADSVIPTGKGLLDRLTERADGVTDSTDQIMKQVGKLVRDENIERIDHMLSESDELITNVNTMSKELTRTLEILRQLLERNEREIDTTLKNVSVASRQLDGVLRETQATIKVGREKVEDADVKGLLDGLAMTNLTVQQKLERVDVESLVQTIATFQSLIVELSKSVGQNQEQLRVMLLNMRRASDNLKDLSQGVRDTPSSLVFEKKPKERPTPD